MARVPPVRRAPQAREVPADGEAVHEGSTSLALEVAEDRRDLAGSVEEAPRR
jgi:hypothetical protein